MGIDVPELHDKDFEELTDRGRKLVSVYSDEWTNHNPHDPGMAILEMLAWVTETYSYQLDQVTDEHRRKYLQLMDERQRPPEPASAQIELRPPEGVSGVVIPADERLVVYDGSDEEKIFQTDEEVVLTDASVARVITESDGDWTDHSHANDTDGMFYRVFGDRPESGDEFYVGFENDPLDQEDTLSVTVDFHDEGLPDPASHGDESPEFDPSMDVVWEYCGNYYAVEDDRAWEPFEVVSDGTDAFYRGGTVTLAAPDEWEPEGWGVDEHELFEGDPGTVWIRCRLEGEGYEVPPQFDSVKLNVTQASHRATVERELLQRDRRERTPEDLSEQRYHFEHAPVLEAEISVGGERWEEVEGLEASGPTDRHYVLNRAEGVVEFGDGLNGKLPEPTQEVVAERYVYGGGEEGNVPESSTWRFSEVSREVAEGVKLMDVEVTPEGDATGGRDAESLEEAFRRIKRDLQTPYRCVTAEDIKYVATSTPGLRFGRSTVLVESNEDAREDRPPEVRVVVVPYTPPDVRGADPSEGFVEAVQDHVDEHRLLADRVTVEPPTYVGLDLEMEVRATGWQLQAAAEEAIESAIAEYVDPIRGYEGEGWPFGRTLYRDELEDVVEDIDWIDAVRELSVRARGNATLDSEENVKVDDDSLFTVENLAVEIVTISGDDDGNDEDDGDDDNGLLG